MSVYPPPPPPAYGPPRKGMAIASLVLGIVGIPTIGCLGAGAIAGIVLGVLALIKAGRSPAEYGGKGMAIAGIVLSGLAIPCGGIVAAIAIPSFLRARVSANEAVAIGDTHSVISAEAAYQSQNNGFYGPLACLSKPDGCIPGYAGPTFLDAQLASAAAKGGYTRTFHPGPPAPADPRVAPNSLVSFAYTAVPVQMGQTGVRGFCGDASGMVCQTMDGSAPPVSEGTCAQPCTPLR